MSVIGDFSDGFYKGFNKEVTVVLTMYLAIDGFMISEGGGCNEYDADDVVALEGEGGNAFCEGLLS